MEELCISWLRVHASIEVSYPSKKEYEVKLGVLTVMDREHIQRKHSLPEYQCRRCRVDLETSDALEAHSQQLQACTPCIGAQDGLSQDQIKKMRSKKGAGKNKSDVDRWNDMYSIVFPFDEKTPSPCMSAFPPHRFCTNQLTT
jgi:hypothetical protein